jgi:transcriptional regulator with XRE-family HTH domain
MTTSEKTWVRQKVGYMPLPRLRKVRLSRNIGVRELARKASISKTTVVRIEQGYMAYGRMAVQLADALEADILELMAPQGLSDEEVEELRRVLAGSSPQAFGRGDTGVEVKTPVHKEEGLTEKT